MVSKKITIIDDTGLHLRPAGQLCKMACEFSSHITFKTKNVEANAKSVLSILGACVKKNDEIELICSGEDEEKALETISTALEKGFQEDK
jgi:phosphocarrier protein